MNKLCLKLKDGAYIHLATDWEEYAVQMLTVLSDVTQLQNTSDTEETLPDGRLVKGFAIRPQYRPVTKF